MMDAIAGETRTATARADAAQPVPAASPGGAGTDPREEIIVHLPALRAFALSLCRDGTLADDLVQDTLLKAWHKFDLFRPGTNLRAWLFTILRNGFFSGRRRGAREVADVDGALTDQLASKPAHDGHLALAELSAALDRLPADQREALILVGALGFSVEEAAETCGCAPGTIKSRANRGRRAIAAMLGLTADEPTNLSRGVADGVLAGLPGHVC